MQQKLVRCLTDVGTPVDSFLSSSPLLTNGRVLYAVYMTVVSVLVASNVIFFMFSRTLEMHFQSIYELIGTLKEVLGDTETQSTKILIEDLHTRNDTIVDSAIEVIGHVIVDKGHFLDHRHVLIPVQGRGHLTGGQDEKDPGLNLQEELDLDLYPHHYHHQLQPQGEDLGLDPENQIDTGKNPNPGGNHNQALDLKIDREIQRPLLAV